MKTTLIHVKAMEKLLDYRIQILTNVIKVCKFSQDF